MNLKLKLSLQFAFMVNIILIFFAALVYYFFYDSQLSKFRENLADTAENSATLLINVVEVDSVLLNKIQQSTSSMDEEEIIITDSAFRIIYDNNSNFLQPDVIRQHYYSGNISYFTIAEKDGVFYRHHYKGVTYYVYAMGYDHTRKENLKELLSVLIWSIIISTILSVYLAYVFSRRAIQPVTRLINSIKLINSLKLSDRLDEGNKKDEIAQLAISFNDMLKNLEQSFKSQELFVSNASHELRTPLTLMLMESDYLLSRPRSEEEYRKHISKLIEDIRDLNTLLNSLLELAHLNKDNLITFDNIRIDELMFICIQKIKTKFEGRKIITQIDYPENENDLLVQGNPGLLSIAFTNVIENACKFSEDDVTIKFSLTESLINVEISDKGIGIPVEQVDQVTTVFNRATNAKFKGGYGIGLALVSKILELHEVDFSITSKENTGTSVLLKFKKHSHITVN